MKMDIVSFWIMSGIALVIGEIVTAGFFLLFLSLGSFAAALAASLGASPLVQGGTFAVVSLIGLVSLRKPIQRHLLKSTNISADVGKEIITDSTILPHHQTRITYQGTSWLASNLDDEEIKKGDRIIIVGIDGNTLLIRKM